MKFIESLPPSWVQPREFGSVGSIEGLPGESLTDHSAALASRVSDEVKNAGCHSESPMLIRNAGIPRVHRSKIAG
jgi:hypothetical protein